jgi:tetratricopeptide (TPR) repeat protein
MFTTKQMRNLVKSILLLVAILFFCNSMFAQEKGIKVTNTTIAEKKGISRALIVGISKYQNSQINLNYADKDAQLFKDFLVRSNTVPNNNIDSLFNNKATGVAINLALNEIAEKSLEGDTVYIYLSGHGDIQTTIGKTRGYFLGYDSSAERVYAGNHGLLSLDFLQEALNFMSTKKVTVHLFLDACHAGATINSEGSIVFNQIAHGNLGKINKYLSSESNQKSYEFGEKATIKQGYFTYYLIKGLMGLADVNPKDNKITFRELDQYVGDEVMKVSNQRQVPKFETENKLATMQNVKPELLQIILNASGDVQIPIKGKGKSVDNTLDENLASFTPAEKLFLDEVNSLLANGDEGIQKAYLLFTNKTYKTKLTAENQLNFCNTLATALGLKPQQAINTILLGKNTEPKAAYFLNAAMFSKQASTLLDTANYYHKIFVISDKYLTAYAYIRNRNYRKYNEAEKLLLEALKLEPNSAFVLHGLGLVASYKNNYPLAESYFKKAMVLIPTWVYPVTSLGNSLKDQGKYKEAIAVFENAIKMAPDFADSYNNLANVYQEMARYNEAESLYKKSMAIDTANIGLELNNLGVLYQERGNIKTAEKYYLSAIARDTTYGKSFANLGYLYMQLEDKRASDYLIKAVDREPFYADLITDLANYYSSSSALADKAKADGLYDEAIANNPFETRAYAQRGWNMYQQDTKKAEKYFLENIKINADKPNAYFYLGAFYEKIGKLTEAENNYKQALKLNPFFYAAYTNLSKLYLRANQSEMAEKTLLDAVPYFELSPVIFNDIGNFYYGDGKVETALKYYLKALSVDKDYAKAYGNLAYTAIEQHEYKTAIDQFKKANINEPIKFNIDDFRLLFLAKMEGLFNEGKFEIALTALNYYQAELPNHTTLQFALGKANYLNNAATTAFSNLNLLDINELRFQEKYMYWQLMGWINLDLEKNENAKACFIKSSQFSANPDQLGLAVCAFIENDKTAAKSNIDKSLQFNNNALEVKKLSIIYSKKSVEKILKMVTEIIK